MTAPYPVEAVAGSAVDPVESEVFNLYRNYAWLARWSDEMNKDVDLNFKKLAQFTFHCRQFRRWYDAINARIASGTHTPLQIAEALEGLFILKKCRWATKLAMKADLDLIYAEAGVFYDWMKVNMPEARTYTRAQFDENFENQTDIPLIGIKSPELATRIAAFRSMFT